MKSCVETRCIVCHLVFCCADCRWKHEQRTHNLTYDCPICRGRRFLCRPEELNQDFIQHLTSEHLPLQCRKCNKFFITMEDFVDIDKCSTISELLDAEIDCKKESIDEKFDSLYEKSNNDNFEAIVSVNNLTKTAVITPIVRKNYLVDYEFSDTDYEEAQKEEMTTPGPINVPKTPKIKRQRAATPHFKKNLNLMRQDVVEVNEDINEDDYLPTDNKTTPSRNDNIGDLDKEMTTPHNPHTLKLAQTVTTSTPTHPVTPNWSLFPVPGADSPLSEIETTESPAQSIDQETDPSKPNSAVGPKLKSIIVVGSRLKLGSQDSSEKQVTFQESTNNSESSIKTRRVKFADDTVFNQEPTIKRASPSTTEETFNSTSSSSSSKRKIEDISDSDLSPLNHKRHKYEGRIRGRPPLHRSRSCGVSSLRTSNSTEEQPLLNRYTKKNFPPPKTTP